METYDFYRKDGNTYTLVVNSPGSKYLVILAESTGFDGVTRFTGYVKTLYGYAIQTLPAKMFITNYESCHFTLDEIRVLIDQQEDSMLGDITAENIQNSIIELEDAEDNFLLEQ